MLKNPYTWSIGEKSPNTIYIYLKNIYYPIPLLSLKNSQTNLLISCHFPKGSILRAVCGDQIFSRNKTYFIQHLMAPHGFSQVHMVNLTFFTNFGKGQDLLNLSIWQFDNAKLIVNDSPGKMAMSLFLCLFAFLVAMRKSMLWNSGLTFSSI